jgi:hypothetical protein
MCQEVMLEHPGRYEDCIEQLLNLRVPYLCMLQDLTNKVHWLLFNLCISFWLLDGVNSSNNCVGGCHIQ